LKKGIKWEVVRGKRGGAWGEGKGWNWGPFFTRGRGETLGTMSRSKPKSMEKTSKGKSEKQKNGKYNGEKSRNTKLKEKLETQKVGLNHETDLQTKHT